MRWSSMMRPDVASVRGRRCGRNAEAGFTLVEVVVALGVFALAALALMQLMTNTVRQQGLLRDRALAGIVVENQLVLMLSGSATLRQEAVRGEEEMGGVVWAWEAVVSAVEVAGVPDMMQVTVTAQRADGEGMNVTPIAAEITGFVRVGS